MHQLIFSATQTKRWALFDRAPLERWANGRIALLGDAAHAMLPFLAQGDAQCVEEDAVTLADCLKSAESGTVETARKRYQELRRPRAHRVLLMSRGREIQNHLPDGPEQQRRDEALAADPLKQIAWLYGDEA